MAGMERKLKVKHETEDFRSKVKAQKIHLDEPILHRSEDRYGLIPCIGNLGIM